MLAGKAGIPTVKRTVQMGQRLWQQSERDIEVARRLLFPGTHYGAANFAHQAAEKALEAAHWHLRGDEPPWKHDLLTCLARIVERIGDVPPDVRAAVVQLQPLFERSRYPSDDAEEPIPADLITEATAQQAVKLAEEVRAWVSTLLQRPPGGGRRKTSS